MTFAVLRIPCDASTQTLHTIPLCPIRLCDWTLCSYFFSRWTFIHLQSMYYTFQIWIFLLLHFRCSSLSQSGMIVINRTSIISCLVSAFEQCLHSKLQGCWDIASAFPWLLPLRCSIENLRVPQYIVPTFPLSYWNVLHVILMLHDLSLRENVGHKGTYENVCCISPTPVISSELHNNFSLSCLLSDCSTQLLSHAHQWLVIELLLLHTH